jgi:hypothetical protein
MPPLTDRDALISWVLKRFWDNARDSTGATIQPESEPVRQRARQMLSESTKQGLEESTESLERTRAN